MNSEDWRKSAAASSLNVGDCFELLDVALFNLLHEVFSLLEVTLEFDADLT
jgi:hypothetical protein